MINNTLLKEEMKAKDINISELSKLSGIDKSIISRILNGETKACTVQTAQRIVSALELSSTQSGLIFFADDVAETQL